MDAIASEGVDPMLRKTMIVLATAAALTGGLTADAFARGGAVFYIQQGKVNPLPR
jgi:hypothetical protein